MNHKQTERVLKGLANSRRMTALKYLSGRDEATVGEIAEHLKLSLRATSRHLGNLLFADLVERRQAGTAVFYRLSRPLPRFVSFVLESW